jgi:hypothetical protein
MSQETLNQLHETIANLVAQHSSGLLTDLEFVYAVSSAGIDTKCAFLKKQLPIHNDDLTGLIDVNTGLRY